MSELIYPKVVVRLYEEDFLSIRDIAKKYKTYPQKIMKILHTAGAKLRDHSAAQKNNLARGGSHPTKGKPRTESSKIKISQGLKDNWDGKTDDDKQKIMAPMQKALSEHKQKGNDVDKKAKKELTKTKFTGSRLEQYIFNRLVSDGYKATYHVKFIMGNDNMEYDIFVSMTHKIAIEIDGPTHQRAVFGEERFEKQKDADSRKDSLTLSHKTHMIRVYADYTNLPLWRKDQIYKSIVESLQELDQSDEFKVKRIGEI